MKVQDEFVQAAGGNDLQLVKELYQRHKNTKVLDVNGFTPKDEVCVTRDLFQFTCPAIIAATLSSHISPEMIQFLVVVAKVNVNVQIKGSDAFFSNRDDVPTRLTILAGAGVLTQLFLTITQCNMRIAKCLLEDGDADPNLEVGVEGVILCEFLALFSQGMLIVAENGDMEELDEVDDLDAALVWYEVWTLLLGAGMFVERVDMDGSTLTRLHELEEQLPPTTCVNCVTHTIRDIKGLVGSRMMITVPGDFLKIYDAKKDIRNAVSVRFHPVLFCAEEDEYQHQQLAGAESILNALMELPGHVFALPESVCFAVMGFLSFNDLPIATSSTRFASDAEDA
jgi:hypothetical protein